MNTVVILKTLYPEFVIFRVYFDVSEMSADYKAEQVTLHYMFRHYVLLIVPPSGNTNHYQSTRFYSFFRLFYN